MRQRQIHWIQQQLTSNHAAGSPAKIVSLTHTHDVNCSTKVRTSEKQRTNCLYTSANTLQIRPYR